MEAARTKAGCGERSRLVVVGELMEAVDPADGVLAISHRQGVSQPLAYPLPSRGAGTNTALCIMVETRAAGDATRSRRAERRGFRPTPRATASAKGALSGTGRAAAARAQPTRRRSERFHKASTVLKVSVGDRCPYWVYRVIVIHFPNTREACHSPNLQAKFPLWIGVSRPDS
jgi:hypothetical protein